jgi:hypothetical protein
VKEILKNYKVGKYSRQRKHVRNLEKDIVTLKLHIRKVQKDTNKNYI